MYHERPSSPWLNTASVCVCVNGENIFYMVAQCINDGLYVKEPNNKNEQQKTEEDQQDGSRGNFIR